MLALIPAVRALPGTERVASSKPARRARLFAIGLSAATATACNTTDFSPPTGPSAPPAVAISAVELPGQWGLASYRSEADKDRTLKEAQSACGNPYVIGTGGAGGVVMHLPDQTQPTEVFIKVARDGKVYIGPKGSAGMAKDRQVLSFDNQSVLVTEWLDPSARERYGTMVFVRCGTKAKTA
jgi:hypothetical protein